MEIGRRIGVLLHEYFGEYNIAELLYQSGDVESAMPHAVRAATFEESHPAIATRPVASLLKARLYAFQGLIDDARALLRRIEAAVQRAKAEGRESGTLAPSEEVLSKMVDLATREASDLEWDQLIARSERESIEQEPIEVVEMRARAAQRLGKAEEARRYFEAALGLAERIPNLMAPRVRKAASALSQVA